MMQMVFKAVIEDIGPLALCTAITLMSFCAATLAVYALQCGHGF
jgi:hypothetical protein